MTTCCLWRWKKTKRITKCIMWSPFPSFWELMLSLSTPWYNNLTLIFLLNYALQHKIHSSLLCLPLFYLSIKSTFSSNSHHVRGLPDNFFFHHAPSLFQYFNFIYCFSHSTRYPSPKHDTTLGKVMYLAMRLYKQKDL